MATNTEATRPHDVIGSSSICKCGRPDTHPIHETAVSPHAPVAVTLTRHQANAACVAIAQVVCAGSIGDANTWHGGNGADLCEFCEALIILRAGADIPAVDSLRP